MKHQSAASSGWPETGTVACEGTAQLEDSYYESLFLKKHVPRGGQPRSIHIISNA